MLSSEIVALRSSGSQIVGSVNATNEIVSSVSPLSPPVVNLDVPKPPDIKDGATLSTSVPPNQTLSGSSNLPHVQGAWAKPLAWFGESMVQSEAPLASSEWPTLPAKTTGKGKRHKEVAGISTAKADVTPPATTHLPTDKTRFPWTARLNPLSRNLHRVTIPEYMEDGTPKEMGSPTWIMACR
ncbi:hypothetical protein N665_0096s0022 [Sinapis alba]|nr:hypothetical protein N665_0096s0022 [Sinapis alba]